MTEFLGYLKVFCKEHGEPLRIQSKPTLDKKTLVISKISCIFGCKFRAEFGPKVFRLKLL